MADPIDYARPSVDADRPRPWAHPAGARAVGSVVLAVIGAPFSLGMAVLLEVALGSSAGWRAGIVAGGIGYALLVLVLMGGMAMAMSARKRNRQESGLMRVTVVATIGLWLNWGGLVLVLLLGWKRLGW